jgi:hypothetical protein
METGSGDGMKTICVVHGVGFGGAEKGERALGTALGLKLGVNIVYYEWDHAGKPPPHIQKVRWPYQELKEYLNEVIMDFAHIVRNLDAILPKVPQADFYVGHSGGTVIVNEFINVPKVLMAAPAQLVANATEIKAAVVTNTLNLMHPYDAIAAPVETAVNRYVEFGLPYPFINPWRAHTGYWYSLGVLKQITDWYKLFVG